MDDKSRQILSNLTPGIPVYVTAKVRNRDAKEIYGEPTEVNVEILGWYRGYRGVNRIEICRNVSYFGETRMYSMAQTVLTADIQKIRRVAPV